MTREQIIDCDMKTIGERRTGWAWFTCAELVENFAQMAELSKKVVANHQLAETADFVERKIAQATSMKRWPHDDDLASPGWCPCSPHIEWTDDIEDRIRIVREKYSWALIQLRRNSREFCLRQSQQPTT